MENKIIFVKGQNRKKIINNLINSKNRFMINFLNGHDVYQFNKEKIFRKVISSDKSINFIDGFLISVFLSLRKIAHVKRYRGPVFTREFLSNENLSGNKKHFFIGLEKNDLNFLSKKFAHLSKKNLFSYNPPFIKDIKFSEHEINKMARLINSKKPDFVWVGIGSPKQNILSDSMIEKTKVKQFFSVGAALDFLLERKKEPKGLIQSIGLEWLYRLLTDFENSKKKVWRSFLSIRYLLKYVKLNEK